MPILNEEETRAELIDPQLKESGWGVVEGSRIRRNYPITRGKIEVGGQRSKPLEADYVLVFHGRTLAVIEAKKISLEVGEGVGQAKNYAQLLKVDTTFSTNGKKIYQMCMKSGEEKLIDRFPTPKELWAKTYAEKNTWKDKFNAISYGGHHERRFYQEIAINKVLDAIAEKQSRILLTMATGTGKTQVAFQIVWKLFQARWNLQYDGQRRPRILFLADRNILANQAFNAFSAFPEDALVRIKPDEIKKKGGVPINGSIFFTIFQTFMSGPDGKPYFGDYPPDYFDFIIVDECHRGGASDESTWRNILEYFSPAVQLGLTATPKYTENANTYRYFGKPVYTYSLKDGINHGFLTPFKVKRIQTTIDDYVYTSDDHILEGEVEHGRRYEEDDFNRIIEIKERESKRVEIILKYLNPSEKTIVFCANQVHAAAIRDLINQKKTSTDPNYCVRVTANDGQIGEEHLEHFRDNEKILPTILTTSHKLSTGVDARNVRNIVLLRPIKSMIEFKQIIGRGTRLFEGKDFFTIFDFVDACKHFSDPQWDGQPIKDIEETIGSSKTPKLKPSKEVDNSNNLEPLPSKKNLKIRLGDGKEREIQYMVQTSFWSVDGKPISVEEFLKKLYGKLPDFFQSEQQLREIWSHPTTRKELLNRLDQAGFGKDDLKTLRKLIDAEKSDLFDVLKYISFTTKPITREERVTHAKPNIFTFLNRKQKEFLDFVLSQYIQSGVEELYEEKLPDLLKLKYRTVHDARQELGDLQKVKTVFIDFQKHLYHQQIAT